MQHEFKSNEDKILKARESVLNRRAEIIRKQALERDQQVIELQQKAIESIGAFIADVQKFLDNAPEEQLLFPIINVPITDNQFQLFSNGDNYQLVQYRILELGFEFDGFDYQRIEIDTPTGTVRNFNYVIKLAYPDTETIDSEERALTYVDDILEVLDGILEKVEGTAHCTEQSEYTFYQRIPKILSSAFAFDKVKEIVNNAVKRQGIYATVGVMSVEKTVHGDSGERLLLTLDRSQFVPIDRHSANDNTSVVTPEIKNKLSKLWRSLTSRGNLGLVVVVAIYITALTLLLLLLKSLSERWPLY